ncbi:MAG TPA: TetR family transcriptional regulator [Candidatus Binataceae bacterium]|nr:TetR family transcriptional regulator [Candidatus Binataceae bacterium]
MATKEDVVKDFRVRELLDATRRVIARYGFEGTTIDRVAEEAKVAKGTIYLYFTKKEDLLHASIFEGLRAMVRESQLADNPALAPLDRIRALVRSQFHIQSSNQDFLKAFFLESSFVNFEPGDSRGEELRRVYIGHLELLASVLEAAMRAGMLRAIDPQFAAFMLSDMITASLRRRLLGLASTPIEADAEVVLEMFLRGVIAA